MIDPASDSELLSRSRNGDHAAFRRLVERHEASVSLTVAGMLGRSADVDDVVQEVFIRFYRGLGQFREESRVDTYLTRIAINRSIDLLRRRKRRSWRLSNLEEAPEPATEEAESPEIKERRRLVRKAIDELPEKYRAVVILRMIQEYSTEETANILDIAYGTVLSRLSRAQDKLRGLLEPIRADQSEK